MKTEERIRGELRRIEEHLNENPNDEEGVSWERALNWVLREEKSK